MMTIYKDWLARRLEKSLKDKSPESILEYARADEKRAPAALAALKAQGTREAARCTAILGVKYKSLVPEVIRTLGGMPSDFDVARRIVIMAENGEHTSEVVRILGRIARHELVLGHTGEATEVLRRIGNMGTIHKSCTSVAYTEIRDICQFVETGSASKRANYFSFLQSAGKPCSTTFQELLKDTENFQSYENTYVGIVDALQTIATHHPDYMKTVLIDLDSMIGTIRALGAVKEIGCRFREHAPECIRILEKSGWEQVAPSICQIARNHEDFAPQAILALKGMKTKESIRQLGVMALMCIRLAPQCVAALEEIGSNEAVEEIGKIGFDVPGQAQPVVDALARIGSERALGLMLYMGEKYNMDGLGAYCFEKILDIEKRSPAEKSIKNRGSVQNSISNLASTMLSGRNLVRQFESAGKTPEGQQSLVASLTDLFTRVDQSGLLPEGHKALDVFTRFVDYKLSLPERQNA